jgi:hypothetical protein
LCELLGMNANVPEDICLRFAGLMRRGRATGPHRDGWGIALYEGNGCRTFRDPKPSAHSEIARFVREYPVKSRIVICHFGALGRIRTADPQIRSLAARIYLRFLMFPERRKKPLHDGVFSRTLLPRRYRK